MKAAALTGINQIEIRECPNPEIQNSNDVLLKVNAVGICGSDIHYYKTGRIGDQIIEYPFVIGHEFTATVSEVGEKVKKVKVGDLVSIDPGISCGNCDQCLMGREHTCRNLRFLGNPDEHAGCFSEYIVMPENCCYHLPANIDSVSGVLVEPLSIGSFAVKYVKNVNIRSVGILGSGPIGLSVMFNLKSKGVKNIYMSDKLEYRNNAASKFGANWVGNPLYDDIVKEIKTREPGLLDVVFECCGEQEALNEALDLLSPGGHLVIVGIPEIENISLNIHKMRRKEITVQNVRRQNNCMLSAIDLISENPEVANIITHKFNFVEIKHAFDLVAGYEDGVIKAVVKIN